MQPDHDLVRAGLTTPGRLRIASAVVVVSAGDDDETLLVSALASGRRHVVRIVSVRLDPD